MAFLNSIVRGQIDNKYIVCCEDELQPTTTTTIGSTVPTSPFSYLPVAPNCGMFSSERIFGAENAIMNEFPWTALLQYTYR